MPPAALSRSHVLALAWPIILAQMATASTGIVDTAIIGHYGTASDLAAVGVAAVVFNFLYWGFGFLRMATTGLTAQAEGAGDGQERNAILARALLLGAGLGLLLLFLFPVLTPAALGLFQASPDVEAGAAAYFGARIWGAPAALMLYGLTGWLIGTGRMRALLAVQVLMNAVNGGLDWLLAGWLGLGPAGIGAGTAMAEWAALGAGLLIVRGHLGRGAPLLDGPRLAALFSANLDIMIRTLALLFSFAWFVNSGAGLGTVVLAGNQVLLQFIAVSAFVLDAFAFVAEKEAGAAWGARDRERLIRAMRVTSELALLCGAVFSLVFWLAGPCVIAVLVSDPAVQATARAYLPWCALVPLIGVAAWQLDGLFLGTTQGPAVRNAGLMAMLAYLASDLILTPYLANAGLWTAFLLSYVYRAGALALYLPGMMRRLEAARASFVREARGGR